MKKMWIGVVAAIAVVAGAGVARAQAPGETPRRDRSEVKRYGATIALCDLAAAGLIVVGALEIDAGDEGAGELAVGAGVLVYVGGGAVVHARHGRGGAALKSVALRALLPVGAGGLLALIGSTKDNRELPIGTMLGGLAGVVIGTATALGIDWFVLAKERHVIPTVAPADGGAIVGLAGAF